MKCKAIWNGATLAESDRCIVTEGNFYFPPESIHAEFLIPSSRRYFCPWKGYAGYYDLVANGKVIRDAAWCYYDVMSEAGSLKNYLAFDKYLGVDVTGEAASRIDPPPVGSGFRRDDPWTR